MSIWDVVITAEEKEQLNDMEFKGALDQSLNIKILQKMIPSAVFPCNFCTTLKSSYVFNGFLMKKITFLFLILISFSCSEDPLQRAQAAHAKRNADDAAQALDLVLSKDPENIEAQRLYADVHLFRQEFEAAEKKLSELWRERNYKLTDTLSLDDRIYRQLIETQFEVLYKEWIAHVNPKTQPELFEKIAKKGLDQNPNNQTLIQKLVKFYFAMGDRLVDGNERIAAAEMFGRILKIQALEPQKKDAKNRMKALQKDVFRQNALRHFEKTILPKLREEKRWEPAKRSVRFRIEGRFSKRMNIKKIGDLDNAKQIAYDQLRKKIEILLRELTQKNERVPKRYIPSYTLRDEKYSNTRFSIFSEIPFEDLLDAGFEFSRQKIKVELPSDQKP